MRKRYGLRVGQKEEGVKRKEGKDRAEEESVMDVRTGERRGTFSAWLGIGVAPGTYETGPLSLSHTQHARLHHTHRRHGVHKCPSTHTHTHKHINTHTPYARLCLD